MKLRLITEPADEPVTLAEAKDHLRIEHTLDDTMIETCIAAARQYSEKYLWRGIVTQTWERVMSSFYEDASCMWHLPKGNLQSVTHVKYLDLDGNQQTWATTEYEVDSTSLPGCVRLGYDKSYPSTRDVWNAVVTRYVVGWNQADVPAAIKQGVLLLTAHFYEFRNPEVMGAPVGKVNFTYEALLRPYRVTRF